MQPERVVRVRGPIKPVPEKLPKSFRPMRRPFLQYMLTLTALILAVSAQRPLLDIDPWFAFVNPFLVAACSWRLSQIFHRHGSSSWHEGYEDAGNDFMRVTAEKLYGSN